MEINSSPIHVCIHDQLLAEQARNAAAPLKIPNVYAIFGAKATELLAKKLGVSEDEIEVKSVTLAQAIKDKSYLGWPEPVDPNQPTWKITLEYNGETHIYLADVRGSTIVPENEWPEVIRYPRTLDI